MDRTPQPALPGRRGTTISIELPADLHFEDDEGNNLGRLGRAAEPARVRPGAVLVAGSEHAWTWAQVLTVEGHWVAFHQLTTAEAAQLAPLVAPAFADRLNVGSVNFHSQLRPGPLGGTGPRAYLCAALVRSWSVEVREAAGIRYAPAPARELRGPREPQHDHAVGADLSDDDLQALGAAVGPREGDSADSAGSGLFMAASWWSVSTPGSAMTPGISLAGGSG